MIRAAIPRIQSIKVTRVLEVGCINWMGTFSLTKTALFLCLPAQEQGRASASEGYSPRLQRSLTLARHGGPGNIDAALEVRAVFDDDAGRLHLAPPGCPGPPRDALRRVPVA